MGVVERVRRRTYEVMEVGRAEDHLSRTVDGIIIALVIGNVLAEILGSVEHIGLAYHDLFLGFEQVSIAVFTVELACRFWAAREADPAAAHPWRSRLRYARSPMAIIDILAIAPFYLSAFFTIDLRFLRILRLLRMVKLTRYSSGMNRMAEVFRMQRSALTTSFFLLSIAIVLSASALHIVERDVQPEAFGSIPAAMWWAVCTLTTVGYGDVLPITALGKLIASFITIIGIGVVALPTSLFASGFAHVMARNEKELEYKARDVLADGVVTNQEAASYADLAESLSIEPEIAREIIDAVSRQRPSGDTLHCPPLRKFRFELTAIRYRRGAMTDLILHHYALSPFAEKIRLALGVKGLAWRSVQTPMVLPKPDHFELTGGYRRVPVLQIGADIHCDTHLILRVLDRLQPSPPLSPPGQGTIEHAVSRWAETSFMMVILAFFGIGGVFPEEFVEDRKKTMIPPSLDLDGASRVVGSKLIQLRNNIERLEDLLIDGRSFLLGDTVSAADLSAYHPLTMLGMHARTQAQLEGLARVRQWMARVAEFGHGEVIPFDSAAAIAVARDAEPADYTGYDGECVLPDGMNIGDPVLVLPDEYGSGNVTGKLAASGISEIAVRRSTQRAGDVIVHFPREDYALISL